MEPLIRVENLNVVYNLGKSSEYRALSEINLEIYPEEFIIFFGPSGCGKSTLLYSISGLERNIMGSIYISGRDIALYSEKETLEFHRKTIGMIFQAFYLIPSLTVVRNVTLPQVFMNQDKSGRRAKALDLLEYFGVKAHAYKMPTELSGGQQQRVAIARSLVNDPDILLADEPVGNLDSKSAMDVMDVLRNLNEKHKKTVILVTHNPAFLGYAHRVFYIKDGRLVDVKVNRKIAGLDLPSMEIKRNVSRDLELLISTFSSLTPDQAGNLLIPFKAKQIVSEVLIQMTSEEVDRIEKQVESMLMTGIYEDDSTYQMLDQSEEQGGLGLDKRTAEKISDRVKDIVKEIKLLEEEDKRIKDKMEKDSGGEVMQIRHYLLEQFEVKIENFVALEILDEAIRERLDSLIDLKTVETRLRTPIKKKGAGLSRNKAHKVAKRLELLILGKYK
jgi:putative ABC transport system ATP-binding protein